MTSDSDIFTFKDIKFPADPVHEYPASLKQGKTPLVIDNGSYMCKAGWITDENPRMIFKNILAKGRSKKDTEFQVGNDISNIEVVRWLLKSQFDRNTVTQFDVQEQIFDHLFGRFGIDTEGCVDHPIVLTEAPCNPSYCRQHMSELLFECYKVPSVFYGIDGLFSLYNNHSDPGSMDGLVISCGQCTTHILPVLNGHLDSSRCRRINVGGSNMNSFMHRLLQLKYPSHFAAITQSRAEEVILDHCKFVTPYLEQLAKWADIDYYESKVHRIQLPFIPQVTSLITPEQLQERKLQKNKKLKEIAHRKREEKLAADQEKLQQLLGVQEMIDDNDDDDDDDDGDGELLERALATFGFSSQEELQEAIEKFSASIERTRAKILGIEIDVQVHEPKEEPVYDLLDIADEELTLEQQKAKKRQRILKNAAEGRARAQKAREEKRQKELEEEKKMEQKRQKDFTGWLKDIREKRQDILGRREKRRQRRTDMAKRRTFASQQRMKIISQLAETKNKKDDTFGQNDDDWNVYKEIQKDGYESDSDAEQEKLEELETLLTEYDEEFEKENADQSGAGAPYDPAEYYRLHVGIEQIRVPELLFQPSMMGMEQAGIAETLEFLLGKYTAEEQNRLTKYVFVTGGPAMIPGLQDRLETELMTMRPFQASFSVHTAKNPSFDAWQGAKKWALSDKFSEYCITRQDYEEKGGDYIKENFLTNNSL